MSRMNQRTTRENKKHRTKNAVGVMNSADNAKCGFCISFAIDFDPFRWVRGKCEGSVMITFFSLHAANISGMTGQ